VSTDRSQPLLRFVLLRSVAFIQLVFFAIWTRQCEFLVGRDGLTPLRDFLFDLTHQLGADAPLRAPTLFWLDDSDGALLAAGFVGMTLSLAALLGVSNAGVQLVLWALAVSVVNAGHDWYGYGWERMMAEASLLAVLLAPWRTWRPRDALRPNTGPHWLDAVPVWLFRWLSFRVLFGAFAVKLRGDPCWTELTCLNWHFETQPNPHALSWFAHRLPGWVHAGGVGLTHLAEGLLPWLLFGPRLGRRAAAVGLAAFQLTLIASGNLAYFNWLTLAVGLSALDDAWVARLAPRFAAAGLESHDARLGASSSGAAASGSAADEVPPAAASFGGSHFALRALRAFALAVVAWRSLPVVENLFFAERQAMNASYDPLHLVNTYGAFGSVGRERYEAVIEGTADDPDDPAARWEPYALPCAPADDVTAPCWVTPYHLHLDWQLWFVPLQGVESHPWLVHLVAKLLDGDALARAQFVDPPFAQTPPRAIRVVRMRTRFTTPDESGWRRRELAGLLVRPLTREDPGLRAALERLGWAATR
jgi:hypothetical protein